MSELQPDGKLQELMRNLMPRTRMPSYRYYQGRRGEMYCWTTEPMDNGKFVCWTYKPIGRGARSGKPRTWKITKRVEFARRKVAKARAYARYMKSIKES